ncbi:hypothetical protein SAMN05428963_10936 [Consotaella salsifontis]|uniref:Fructose-bisphosphate aldolase class Ia, DhnA family n=1 Tax=Consotaella salsifontis TaxID=1365950 RepID=A0A1T4S664_9HYPH|nr:hypothetical protein SAMN05428963_10936 [Consotaella salsifontis]
MRLEQKLENIRAGRYTPADFMIADAKDGDMGSGVSASAPRRNADGSWQRYNTRSEFLDNIQAIIEQDIVDIMLVSASNLELLHERGAFAGSAVKPAIRANDTTDCWGGVRHAIYPKRPSRPFRTANLSQVMYGTDTPEPGAPITGTDLGLYSITFLNDVEADAAALEAFTAFRADAAANGFKYFLEVFNPNVPCGLEPEQIGAYVNDCILRCLAGVLKAHRPQFLKIPFNGPEALEELASFDPSLVVGVLGGGAGTTRDTFELIAQAERFGGRLALFGRKINLAEDPLEVVRLMREVVNGAVAPEEAVRAYHGALQKKGIRSHRELADDRKVTEAPLMRAASQQRAA